MKTQISRISFAPLKRYSGVYQQMGRMFTDADWNELAEIVKRRLADTTDDTIGSGTPREGGLVARSDGGGEPSYRLRWGRVYVEGIGADVLPGPGSAEDGLFDYAHQADFPQAPMPDGDHVLYLDVWERGVTALEDDALRDPGLHGADTCSRTQTMAQVKWCLSGTAPDNPVLNPRIGTAALTLELRQGSTEADHCDPCADEIPLQDTLEDYLFRVEIHDVQYDSAGHPTRVTLKWSAENGAEQYDHQDLPPGFAAAHWVYEFFSGADQDFASEKQLGRHLADGFAPVRHGLVAGYPDTVPADFPLVRRWDGYCTLTKSGGDWTLEEGVDRGVELSDSLGAAAHGYFQQGATATINLESIVLKAALGDAAQLAGDYWTAMVRRAVNRAGDTLLDNAPAQGIEHHYLVLGAVRGDTFTPEPAEDCRRFEFPTLTDLRARDVCYTLHDCATDGPTVQGLLGEKDEGFPRVGDPQSTVGQVLDALLCRQNAATIPIDPGPNLCPDLQGAEIKTIQDALNALCQRGIEGCATLTVFPHPGWESVFDQIPDGADAHLCFREGDYPLAETVTVTGKGHLKITGAGPGTRIVCKKREAALIFDRCLGVQVADLYAEGGAVGSEKELEHLSGALTFVDCPAVSLANATLRCAHDTRPAATCLTVRNPGGKGGRASVTGCRLEIGHRQTGMLLTDLDHTIVRDNELVTRAKPRSFTLERQLADPKLAARARHLLINRGVVRNFEKKSVTAGKKALQLDTQGQRRIMFDSHVAANSWKDAILAHVGQQVLASNQQLLNTAKAVATRIVTQPSFRARFSPFVNWFDHLRQQDPAVSYKGIVCAGHTARDVQILNNSLDGVQEGIHVGVSDHGPGNPNHQRYLAGRVLIEGNTIGVRLPPLAIHRRGGIFVGNCNYLTVQNNQIQVQRYLWSRAIPIEGVRVFGYLGRMMLVRQNYMTHCTTGVRVQPLNGPSKKTNQWQVADNMMPDVESIVNAPFSVHRWNNYD